MKVLELNLDGLLILIILVWAVPPLILWSIAGILHYKKNKNAAKLFVIFGVVYLLILGGICLSIL